MTEIRREPPSQTLQQRLDSINLLLKMFDINAVVTYWDSKRMLPFLLSGVIDGVAMGTSLATIEAAEELAHSFMSGRPNPTIADSLRK
jgi:hypothetical protein